MKGVTNPLLNKDLQNLSGEDFFAKLLPMLITVTLVIAAIIFIFMMLLGGISWMTAGGDKQKVESARGHLTSALIGLFIVFTVFALATLLEGLFDINILVLDISKLAL
ncbi:hypothetical protein HY404_02520 [Candidatus Microgenomates bacterium]|nr:hypothetical protein [Candidatus Microgenomates bacterium]